MGRREQTLLSVSQLDVSYGAAQIISDLSMEIEEEKITVIIGPNGAGKSTLLNTLAGVIRQTRGTVLFKGEPIQDLPTRKRVSKGLVQCPERRRLFPNLRVKDNVQLGAYLRKDDTVDQDMEKVHKLFPILKDRANQLAGTLSGGEQQMVAIARSLMSAPKLLMLDEPSLGLSPIMREKIFDAILEIRDISEVTVLLVEQDAVDALSIGQNVYVLESGQITMKGTKEEMAGNSHVKEAFLGL